MDAGFQGFEVSPKRDCPHARKTSRGGVLPESFSLEASPGQNCQFEECSYAPPASGKASELTNMWMCLTCNKTFCGRVVHGHAVSHAKNTGHTIALGFDDLSFWCYGESDGCSGCDFYVDNYSLEDLHPSYSWAHKLKFGSVPETPNFAANARASSDSGISLVLETVSPKK